ncbi:MAG: hypothetical protein SGPRY_006993, partial [Prymnesium sp.]
DESGHATGKGVMCLGLPVDSASPTHPAGEWVASGAQDGYICIWDLRHGSVLQRLRLRHWVMAADVACVASENAEAMGGGALVGQTLPVHLLPSHSLLSPAVPSTFLLSPPL